MSTVAKIAPRQTEVDPLRAELAAAIRAAAPARDAVVAAEEALQRGRQLVVDAEAAIEAASTSVGRAREQDARAAAKAIKARTGAPAQGATRKARADLSAAEDEAEIARSAIESLEEELREAVEQAAWRENDVAAARNALLASLAMKILEDGRAARLRAVVAENVLFELVHGSDGGGPAFDDALDRIHAQEQRDSPLRALKQEAEYFRGAGTGDGERSAIDRAVAAARRFIADLERDATAEMPPEMIR